MNKRNMTHQIVRLKDGSQKVIHHNKQVPNGDFKTFWRQLNESPKPNSKRQKKLREQKSVVTI